MSVNVTDNTAVVAFKTINSAALFLRFLMDDIDRLAFPITPMKEGRLRESPLKIVTGLKGVMTWNKVYAAPQEVGIIKGHQVRKYTTPGTGAHYALRGVEKAIVNAETTMIKARLI